jgi:alpha-glucosidase (family GH31 glycosyl hydrolase)
MKRYDWCSFSWDPEAFPEPERYLKEIKEEYNVKVCAWVNPYIAQRAEIFKEGAAKGYFVTRTDGSVWQWCVTTRRTSLRTRDEWQPGMAVVDFTNPEARVWYSGLIEKLLLTGVDTIKTDFGERIPHLGIKWHDGSDPWKMHK